MTSSAPTTLLRLVSVFWPYLRRRWTGLLRILTITLLMTALSVLQPWPMKFIVDYVLLKEPVPEGAAPLLRLLPGIDNPAGMLWWGVAGTVVLFLLGWIARLANAIANVAFGQRMVYDLAADLFAHLQRLSLRFHHRQAVGDSIRRVTNDCACISQILRDALLPVISSLVTLIIMAGIMWKLDPLLTLLAFAVMPLLVIILRLYAQPMMDRSYRQQEVEGRIYSDIEQTFSSIATVQVFAREASNDEQFNIKTRDALAATLATTNVQLQFKVLVGLCTAIGTAAIIWVGARHAMNGTLTAGTILVFLWYLTALYAPIESMMYSSFAAQGAAGSARRVVEILHTQRDVDDRPGAVALPPVNGQISFDAVTFGYDAGRDVLHGITLHLTPGQCVAIVGATGAGKSTLVGLLPRFNDPRVGRVIVDGHDLRDVTLASLRRQISLVLQDSFLFSMSIGENIAYGRPEATAAQIVAAAKAANVHEFIMKLPQGYDTPVGERGATLSGGERQRIAIARALLRDAPILILDEPTSNLDAATEQAVLDATRHLMRGRTTLVIAHRLSTVRQADRIVVLEHGRIVEEGTHDQLLSRKGPYARLHGTQQLQANGGPSA